MTLESAELETLTGLVLQRCNELAKCTEEPGRVTRTFLSGAARQAMQLVETWMQNANLKTQIDATGNVRGFKPSRVVGAKTLVIGSHIDTVPNAGRFDGVLGVVLAIAMAQALEKTELPFHLEIVAFSEEEGVRFAAPFIGSRALVGNIDAALLERKDANGTNLSQAIQEFGLDTNQIPMAALDNALGYFEIHIEQGPVLESLGLALGAVTGIAGQTRLSLDFLGRAAHAGTTPMHLRRDALTAAALFIVEVERCARATNGLVATVGALQVEPGAGNVVAAKCTLSLDVRHIDDATREKAVAELLDFAWQTAQRRKLDVKYETKLEQKAVASDQLWTDFLGDAIEDAGFKLHKLASGAGHDAMVMAKLGPMTMLFVRSPGGVSHHPDETVVPSDVRAALGVALGFVVKLAGHFVVAN